MPAGYASLILSANPQAYYRMNETSGLIAYDSSGNGYNATLSGVLDYGEPGAILADSDTSLFFSANGGLTLPPTLDVMSFSALTIEFWFNIGFGWYYTVVAVDASSTILYLNGSVVSAGYITGASMLVDTIMEFVGNLMAASNVDEVAIYNYKFTPGQVADHWAIGTLAPSPVFPLVTLPFPLGVTTCFPIPQPAFAYVMNGVSLDRASVVTAPLLQGGFVLQGESFLLVWTTMPSTPTQNALTSGARGSMTFAVHDGGSITAPISVLSGTTGSIFWATCTVLVSTMISKRTIITQFM